MDLLEVLKIPLLNFNFVMTYIIHKMLVLIKNNLNYFKDSIFECFFKEYNRLLIFVKKILFFSIKYNNSKLNYTAIKDIRNPFRQEKKTQSN